MGRDRIPETVTVSESRVRPVDWECWEVVGEALPQELFRIIELHQDLKDSLLYDEEESMQATYTTMWDRRGISGHLAETDWPMEMVHKILGKGDERMLGTTRLQERVLEMQFARPRVTCPSNFIGNVVGAC